MADECSALNKTVILFSAKPRDIAKVGQKQCRNQSIGSRLLNAATWARQPLQELTAAGVACTGSVQNGLVNCHGWKEGRLRRSNFSLLNCWLLIGSGRWCLRYFSTAVIKLYHQCNLEKDTFTGA